MMLDVPHYEPRLVEILFSVERPNRPKISTDGPLESPHRFSDGCLCIWYPPDPVSAKWRVQDGLLSLLGMTSAHLFREAWWREMDDWLGSEVEHGVQDKDLEE